MRVWTGGWGRGGDTTSRFRDRETPGSNPGPPTIWYPQHLMYLSVVAADQIPIVSRVDGAMFGYLAFQAGSQMARCSATWLFKLAAKQCDCRLRSAIDDPARHAVNLGCTSGYRIRGADVEAMLWTEYEGISAYLRRASHAMNEAADAAAYRQPSSQGLQDLQPLMAAPHIYNSGDEAFQVVAVMVRDCQCRCPAHPIAVGHDLDSEGGVEQSARHRARPTGSHGRTPVARIFEEQGVGTTTCDAFPDWRRRASCVPSIGRACGRCAAAEAI